MKTLLPLLFSIAFLHTHATEDICFTPFDKTSPSCEMRADYVRTIDRLWFSTNQCNGAKTDRFYAVAFDISVIVPGDGWDGPDQIEYYSVFENGLLDENSRSFLFEKLNTGDRVVFSNIAIVVNGESQSAQDLTIIIDAGDLVDLPINSKPKKDSCHSLFDISLSHPEYGNRVNSVTLPLERFLTLKTLLFSYNYCDGIAEKETYLTKARVIVVPQSKPASMASFNSPDLTKTYFRLLEQADLQPGDRILFEYLQYERDGVIHNLKPLSITIE